MRAEEYLESLKLGYTDINGKKYLSKSLVIRLMDLWVSVTNYEKQKK